MENRLYCELFEYFVANINWSHEESLTEVVVIGYQTEKFATQVIR